MSSALNEEVKSMTQWSEEIHQWACAKGWWSRQSDTIAAKLLLVHSEVSEAAEELRKARPCPHGSPEVDFDDLCVRRFKYDRIGLDVDLDYFRVRRFKYDRSGLETEVPTIGEHIGKPVGFPSEIADTLIRLLDLCGRLGLNPDAIVAEKMRYNWTRKERHGGKSL